MDPITVALKQEGAEAVKEALRGVQAAIVALDSFSATSARNAGKERIRAVREEAAERKRMRLPDAISSSRRNSRDSFDRALGRGREQKAAVERAKSGPSIGEYAGLASSGAGSLMGTIGKFGAIGGAIALFKGGLDLAADALKQFGGFLISDVIKPAFALETAATQLENASGGQIKAAEIMEKSRSAGIKHNMDPMALFEAAGAMIDLTGDAKTSFDLLDTIGTLSKARGADPAQLAEFAAALKNFDPNATSEQISKLLLTQLAQGDQGSVPLKEAAKLGGRLTAPAAFLSGNTDVRMASMGALLQSGRKGFGSTDELITGIGNLINEVSSQKMVGSKKYLNADGQIGDVASLIGGILKDTGGDAKKIGALGLSDPAAKLVKSYLPAFSEAGKGDQGKAAVESLIRGFMEASTSLDREKENERKVLQTSGEKWNAAIAGVKDKLLEIMPEVEKLVDSLAQKGPEIASAVTSIAKALVSLAAWINDWFGDDDASQKDIPSIDSVTGENVTVKQYEIDERARSDAFNPDAYQGGRDLTAEEFDAQLAREKEAQAPPLLDPQLQQPGISVVIPPLVGAPAASSSSSEQSANIDGTLASIDALGPKLSRLGSALDKVASSANDAARTKPLSQR